MKISVKDIESFMLMTGVFGTKDAPGTILYSVQLGIIEALRMKQKRDGYIAIRDDPPSERKG